jgi:hypothetical protein
MGFLLGDDFAAVRFQPNARKVLFVAAAFRSIAERRDGMRVWPAQGRYGKYQRKTSDRLFYELVTS